MSWKKIYLEFRVHRKKCTSDHAIHWVITTKSSSCLWRQGLIKYPRNREVSGFHGLASEGLIWKALESRYLKKTTTKDALGNILDSLSLRIMKAIRVPLEG